MKGQRRIATVAPDEPVIQTKGMDEIKLDDQTERLRAACETEALKHWPGARVLVHQVAEQYRAAVYLPEDGVSLATSAERSAPQGSPREALDELSGLIRKQISPLLA